MYMYYVYQDMKNCGFSSNQTNSNINFKGTKYWFNGV